VSGPLAHPKGTVGLILGIDLLPIQSSHWANAVIANETSIRNNSSALKGFVDFFFCINRFAMTFDCFRRGRQRSGQERESLKTSAIGN
jgi:hypothetical protein